MQVYINGVAHLVQNEQSLEDLIKLFGLEGKRIAIEINQELVPRSRLKYRLLSDQDQIEIIHAVGGG